LSQAATAAVLASLLAKCQHWGQYECMSVQITIRDVSEKVRDELAARAALQGKSMQEFLHNELRRMVARPSIDAWLNQVRKRKRATQGRVSVEQILNARDADRR
jgi:plasmid stability protein